MNPKQGEAFVWRGRYIEVDVTADGRRVWSFWACCRCGRELFDGRSIAEGIGPECRRRMTATEAERLREKAREIDRLRYRMNRQRERAWNELQARIREAKQAAGLLPSDEQLRLEAGSEPAQEACATERWRDVSLSEGLRAPPEASG